VAALIATHMSAPVSEQVMRAAMANAVQELGTNGLCTARGCTFTVHAQGFCIGHQELSPAEQMLAAVVGGTVRNALAKFGKPVQADQSPLPPPPEEGEQAALWLTKLSKKETIETEIIIQPEGGGPLGTLTLPLPLPYPSSMGGGKTKAKCKCKTPGCNTNVHSKGLCQKHGAKGVCTHSGCTSFVFQRKLCVVHGGTGIGGSKCSHEGCTSIKHSRGASPV
jgi:hypothetical protein